MQTVTARHKLNPGTLVEIPLAWKATPLWAMYDIVEGDPDCVTCKEPEAPKSRGRRWTAEPEIVEETPSDE